MQVLLSGLSHIFSTLIKGLKDILLSIVNFLLSLIFQFWPLISIAHFVREKIPWLWNLAMRLDVVKKAMSIGVFNRFGGATIERPHSHTMIAEYPTWYGYMDRTITARHLPPDHNADGKPRPDIQALEDLFLRKSETGDQTDDIRTNLLFASFAQWFTDSFLRTSHSLELDDCGNTQTNDDGSLKRVPGRAQRNESNHEIDLCQIYGMDEQKTRLLRVDTLAEGFQPKDRGCLRSKIYPDGEFPEFILDDVPTEEGEKLSVRPEFANLHAEPLLRSVFRGAAKNDEGYNTLFAVGLEHGNSTIGNSLFNVIFLRHHNWVARKIGVANPSWDDEKVFQLTRNTMIVLILRVVVSDYIRHISPLNLPLGIYKGVGDHQNWYRPNRIHFEFNILYRWHGFVPDIFPFLPDTDDPKVNFARFRHNNAWLLQNGVAAALHEFSKVPAGRMMMGNTPALLRMVKRDTLRLMRDGDLASYNAYRKRFGLKEAETFEEVTGETKLAAELSRLYGDDIDALEWYIGMVSEQHGHNMIMGDLMFNMVAHDAFTHALTNPLLANDVYKPATFSQTGWDIIHDTTTLSEIVARVAPLSDGQVMGLSVTG